MIIKYIEKHPRRILIETIMIISISLLFIYIYINNFELLNVENPTNGAVVLDRYPEINWKGNSNSYTILISKNIEFNPLIINKTQKSTYLKINHKLEFGDYYLKIIDDDNNKYQIIKFTIDSYVAISLDKEGNVINEGNSDIKVSNTISNTGFMILNINQMLNKKLITNNTEFLQNE